MKKILNQSTTEKDGNFYCKNCGSIKDYSNDICEECSGDCEGCKNKEGIFVGFEMGKCPIFFCVDCGKFNNGKLNLREDEY